MLTNVVRVGTENLLSELVMNSINNNDETNNGNTQCDTDKIKSSILTIDATSGSLHGETQNKRICRASGLKMHKNRIKKGIHMRTSTS